MSILNLKLNRKILFGFVFGHEWLVVSENCYFTPNTDLISSELKTLISEILSFEVEVMNRTV